MCHCSTCIRTCGPQEYYHGMLQLVQIRSKSALVVASHDYVLKTQMNKCTLVNNVMKMTYLARLRACNMSSKYYEGRRGLLIVLIS